MQLVNIGLGEYYLKDILGTRLGEKMNIAIDVIPIRNTGEMGGAFQTVVELIKGLAMLKEADKYYLITAEWNHDFFEPFEKMGIERILLSSSPNNGRKSQSRLLSKIKSKTSKLFKKINYFDNKNYILKSRSIDVLFCPMSAINYSEPGIPILSLIYDLQHEYYPQFFSSEELNHRKQFYIDIAEKADYVACISEFTKNSFVDKLDFPPEKAEVIHISIQNRANNLNENEINEIIKKFGFSERKYIYYPANFWQHKNHRILLMAMAILKQKRPELELHLCLTGNLLGKEEEFEDILRQMNLKDCVHHCGYITDKEVAALMAGSSALVFPSLFEGFGIPIVEAMSSGVPVLCSDRTSLPEVGGDAVLYFDPRKPEEIADRIYEVMADAEMQNRMREKGLLQVMKFDNAQMITQYHNLIKKTANGKSNNKYTIEGLYADGWSGKKIDIYLKSNTEKSRVLNVELNLPPFSPNKKVKLIIKNNNKVKKINIYSGENIVIMESLSKEAKEVSLEISATFIPSEIGLPDDRELGVLISKMNILGNEDGHVIKSFI